MAKRSALGNVRWWLPPVVFVLAMGSLLASLGAILGAPTGPRPAPWLVSSEDRNQDWVGLYLPSDVSAPGSWWCFDPGDVPSPSRAMREAHRKKQQLCLVTQEILSNGDEEVLDDNDVAAEVQRQLSQLNQPVPTITQQVVVREEAGSGGVQWAAWAAALVAALALAVSVWDRRHGLRAWVRRGPRLAVRDESSEPAIRPRRMI